MDNIIGSQAFSTRSLTSIFLSQYKEIKTYESL